MVALPTLPLGYPLLVSSYPEPLNPTLKAGKSTQWNLTHDMDGVLGVRKVVNNKKTKTLQKGKQYWKIIEKRRQCKTIRVWVEEWQWGQPMHCNVATDASTFENILLSKKVEWRQNRLCWASTPQHECTSGKVTEHPLVDNNRLGYFPKNQKFRHSLGVSMTLV